MLSSLLNRSIAQLYLFSSSCPAKITFCHYSFAYISIVWLNRTQTCEAKRWVWQFQNSRRWNLNKLFFHFIFISTMTNCSQRFVGFLLFFEHLWEMFDRSRVGRFDIGQCSRRAENSIALSISISSEWEKQKWNVFSYLLQLFAAVSLFHFVFGWWALTNQ